MRLLVHLCKDPVTCRPLHMVQTYLIATGMLRGSSVGMSDARRSELLFDHALLFECIAQR